MTNPYIEKLAERMSEELGAYGQFTISRDMPACVDLVRVLLTKMREPSHEQMRALLIHRGYDPDAKAETLDAFGNLDVMTMGSFARAYTAMIDAALAEEPAAVDAG